MDVSRAEREGLLGGEELSGAIERGPAPSPDDGCQANRGGTSSALITHDALEVCHHAAEHRLHLVDLDDDQIAATERMFERLSRAWREQ